ncbi:hypothetical protein [Hymenobacter terrestris]|uniref:Uncharacterized protein n=1 Tax=Hymenobacter terrestris TaxID=2748310 RepID=A0ABX2Q3Q5_9BACT|nr:hypothetical protein [Hymenobacter terrestris]NVO85468.1 hypothetical protein [Hymenobacter terrestris]
MKIPVEKGQEKGFLSDGRHTVEITEIEEGKSENQGIPYFAARMENEEGFVLQRFYLSDAGRPVIMGLYDTVGIEPKAGQDLDTKQLIGKKLSVEVGDYTYNDPNSGSERTLRQASHFQRV